MLVTKKKTHFCKILRIIWFFYKIFIIPLYIWGTRQICPKNVVNNKKVRTINRTASQLLVVPNNWGAVQMDCEAISFNNGLV